MGVSWAAATLAVCLWVVWDLTRGGARLPRLGDFREEPKTVAPSVSICFSARNERRSVRRAVRGFLRQDHPDLEVVAVDDRSTDGTGPILDALAAEDDRLRVIHVRQLPPGWLGKNHGLHTAAGAARGEWLLFTDADVELHPRAVADALAAARQLRADHLAVGPEVLARNWPLGVAVSFFQLLFGLYSRPWAAGKPGRWHVGIGAFNWVRASAYRAIGGHRKLRLRPDDDMQLGKRLKEAGFRTRALWGRDRVRVEWYRSVPELVRGLEKNTFAGLGYRLSLAVAAGLAQFAVFVWPFLAVWVTEGAVRLLYLGCAASLLWLQTRQAAVQGYPRWYGLLLPASAVLLLYIQGNAVWKTLHQGGIRWRGTFDPLEQLRER